jgi:Ser/Thr protein kinase RdoA (MazF antagonist)
MNAQQSRHVDYIDAQNALLDHLIKQGFNVPKIVNTIHAEGYTTKAIGGGIPQC